MQEKKDNIITKINTERSFADEIYRKYRSTRYGIGTCCDANLPSSIKSKYLCDYQDSKVTQYDSVTRTNTSYTPPTGGAEGDSNRPAWVDELCGMSNGEIEIYFYYDSTSLGLTQVQNAYTAASQWVNLIRSNSSTNSSCGGTSTQNIIEYHTTVFGERWLDWGSSAMSGQFQNAGSCGGQNSCNNAGQAVNAAGNTGPGKDSNPNRNFGLCTTISASDAVYGKNVTTTNNFWSVLEWSRVNSLGFYNANSSLSSNSTGNTVLGLVASSVITSNTSGGLFNSVVTKGFPPAATKKNVLVICFGDESTSGNDGGAVVPQPYHTRASSLTTPMTWKLATNNVGSADSGSDAVIPPCWQADFDQFLIERQLWLNVDPGRNINFYLYPSAPVDAYGNLANNNSAQVFPLHALGAISSGDKVDAKASATITITGSPTNSQTITIKSNTTTLIDSAFLSKVYTAAAVTNVATGAFISTGSVTDIATALKACIENAAGHNGTITVTQSAGVLTLTQTIDGGIGNTLIVSTLSNVTFTSFTGGLPDGTFTTAPTNTLTSLLNITKGNPYYANAVGGLDKFGWGINAEEKLFNSTIFKSDLDSFADLTSCNDSECFLFVIKNNLGFPVENHPVVFNGSVIGYSDENGLLRHCIENASVNRTQVLDLCYCITTTGGCKSQKINITLTDNLLTACPVAPFQACAPADEVVSSGNDLKGCTDATADNYDPNATVDDASCLYCNSLTVTQTSVDATESGGNCNNDGSITTSVTGGVSPYTFSWLKNSVIFATTQNLTGLCGGSYLVTVTDSSLEPCITTLTVNIDQPATIIYGCTDNTACNYDSTATIDDGTCLYSGCTDITATDYDASATADCNCNPPVSSLYQNAANWNSCCTACVNGCTDSFANNYSSSATCDDGTCEYNYDCESSAGIPETNTCSTKLNLGTYALNDWYGVLDNFALTSNINSPLANYSLYWSGSVPLPGQCTEPSTGDAQVNLQNFVTRFKWQNGDIVGNPTNNDITNTYVQCSGYNWPSSWTWQPTGTIGEIVIGSINNISQSESNWGDFIGALNSTITDGQSWVNLSNVAVTTFQGLNATQIRDIFIASQGTNLGAQQDLLFPTCPSIGLFLADDISIPKCVCSAGVPSTCNCVEKTDGSGTYPDAATCANGTNCCNTPPDKYLCVPGVITDNCNKKTELSATILSSTNTSTNAGNLWTTTLPSNVSPDDFYFWVDTGAGSCYDATLQASKYFIKSLSLYDNNILTPQTPVTQIIAGASVSWVNMTNTLNTVYGYDGVTYPLIDSSSSMSAARGILDIAEPGRWDITCNVSLCSCNQSSCSCIQDNTGSYSTYNSCIGNCCPYQVYGCTDPSAFNYNPSVTQDDGSCLLCNQLGTVLTASNIVSVNNSGTGICDGTITFDMSQSTNTTWILYDNNGGIIQQAVGTSNGIGVTISNLCAGSYVLYTASLNILNGVILGVICDNSNVLAIGPTQNSTLWDCLPGTVDDSTTTNNQVSVTTLMQNQLANQTFNTPQVALNIITIEQPNSLLSNWWFYVKKTSTFFPQAYVPGPTDCFSDSSFNQMLPSVKMEVKEINIMYGAVTVFTASNSQTWKDVTDFVSGLGMVMPSTGPSYLQVIQLLAGFQSGRYTINTEYQKAICNYTNCGCVQSPTGAYSNQTDCSSNCCVTGCTDPTANNYNTSATIDDGSCFYCNNFSAVLSVNTSPTIPTTSDTTIWSASNINVNNGSITGTGIGGSGSYSVKVYYDGYNNNNLVDANNLWPGRYCIEVEDIVRGCIRKVCGIQVNPLKATCHNGGNPWIPESVFGNSSTIHNLLSYDPLNSLNGATNVVNNTTALGGFTIGNLYAIPSSIVYSIKVYTILGVIVASGTSITVLDTGALPAATYYIQVQSNLAAGCSEIGMIINYDGLANINGTN